MGVKTKDYLIDTNILIDYLVDRLPSPAVDLIEEIIEKSLNVSVITQIEFLGWHNHTHQSKAAAEDIITHASIIHLEQEIIDETIFLKQTLRVKIPDAIIAASSRVHHMILIAGNEKHFEKIPGVNIYNPWNNTRLP